MTRARTLGALLFVGSAVIAIGAVQQAPAAADIQVDRVKDNLYVLRGGGGNTAAFVTSTGVVLVDTKVPGWGTPLLEKLREVTDKPVTTIVNTHTHFDHVGGNVEFPADVEVVAHANTATLMREMRPVTGGPDQPKVFAGAGSRGLPKRTFTDRMTIGAGADRVELYYFGPAHTNGDAWVVFPSLRAVHTGDVFPNKGIPLIDANNGGSGVEYPNTIGRAVAAFADVDTVITGHFATTLTVADLATYGQFTRDIIEAVRAAKRAGRTIDEVASSWKVPERFIREGYTQVGSDPRMAASRLRTNVVEVIWKELK